MTGFENTLRSAALALLKRELTEEERVEFLELAGAIGMGTVEDYLYMLMIFKRNEDRTRGQLTTFDDEMKARFERMEALEKKIDATLAASISRILGDGAREIGRDMGRHIALSAREVLVPYREFHFLRGQVMIVFLMAFLSTVAYWLGSVKFMRSDGAGFFRILLSLPASGVAFVCGFAYCVAWGFDHWERIRCYFTYKVAVCLQIGLLILLYLCFIG